jgi:hypothetical protein
MNTYRRTLVHVLNNAIILHHKDKAPQTIRAKVEFCHSTCILVCAANQQTAITSAPTITWSPRTPYHSNTPITGLGPTTLVLLPGSTPRRIDNNHIQFDCRVLSCLDPQSAQHPNLLSIRPVDALRPSIILTRYTVHTDQQCTFERLINQTIVQPRMHPARLVLSGSEQADQILSLQTGTKIALALIVRQSLIDTDSDPPATTHLPKQWIITRLRRFIQPESTAWDLHLEENFTPTE